MKQQPWVRASVLGIVLAFFASMAYVPDAEARRFGGGASFGRSSGSFFKKPAPVQKTAPTQSATQQNATKQPGATQQSATRQGTTTAAQPRRSFMGPLGGLAAGLGLAALFGYLGFGEGMASFLGTMLMLVIGFFLIRALFRRLAGTSQQPRPAYASERSQWQQANQTLQPVPLRRSPLNSEVSGQPTLGADNQSPSGQGSAESMKALPAGFDEAAFVQSAKQFFVMIQAEFDKGNLDTLREYCTDEVLHFAARDLEERGGAENHTSVVTLEAELIGFETDVDEQLATVAFDAMLREERDGAATEIHELWVMSRPVSGGGWVLAGIQNL